MSAPTKAQHPDPSQEWAVEADAIQRTGHVWQPWLQEALGWLADLHPGPVRRVMDVGSGPGVATSAIAQAFPEATIVALDPVAGFIERVREQGIELGLPPERVETHVGDLEHRLPALEPAELVWSRGVVHHLPEPVAGLRRLGDALSPGGLLAVAEGGLAPRYLPGGYGVGAPSFVLRLEATLSDYFRQRWDLVPAAVGGAADWPEMIRQAGLIPLRTRTFLLERRAPLDPEVREDVVAHMHRVRDLIGDRLSAQDGDALDILLDQRDQRSMAQRPDLFVLAAQTVHVASRRDGSTE